MGLRLRLYEKKRGTRRTGSRQLGSAGLALFFALFLAVGCSWLGYLLWNLVLPEWWANRHFVEHACTVLNTRVAENPSGGPGKTYRPEVQIRYELDGRTYRIWTYDSAGVYSSGWKDKQAVIEQFEIGKQYPCWYDPENPRRAVLVRGFTWFAWITLLLPASFMIIGGGGLAYTLWNWGKSAERRNALSRQAPLDLFEPASAAEREFPSVPGGANLTDSPGTKLKYRLPMAASPAWALSALVVGCLLWNAMVVMFAAVAVDRFLNGQPDWLLVALLLPFLAAGVWLVYYTFQKLLLTTGVGPTFLEISDHPLRPGQAYQVCLSQAGRLSVNSLEVALVCEERATYQQGTNTRTDLRQVHRQPILKRTAFEIQPGAPFEVQATLQVPANAMHSFRASYNEVAWKLIVQGDVAGWPRYQRDFPVIVLPGTNGAPAA